MLLLFNHHNLPTGLRFTLAAAITCTSLAMQGAALTKPPDLQFLTGIRALSSIAVVLYHCHRVLGLLVGAAGTASLLHTSLLFRYTTSSLQPALQTL